MNSIKKQTLSSIRRCTVRHTMDAIGKQNFSSIRPNLIGHFLRTISANLLKFPNGIQVVNATYKTYVLRIIQILGYNLSGVFSFCFLNRKIRSLRNEDSEDRTDSLQFDSVDRSLTKTRMKTSRIASITWNSDGNRFANAVSRITPRSPIQLPRAVCNWHNGEFTPIEYCSWLVTRSVGYSGDSIRSSLTLSGINVTVRSGWLADDDFR